MSDHAIPSFIRQAQIPKETRIVGIYTAITKSLSPLFIKAIFPSIATKLEAFWIPELWQSLYDF